MHQDVVKMTARIPFFFLLSRLGTLWGNEIFNRESIDVRENIAEILLLSTNKIWFFYTVL
ncbi:hypothetical protein HanIR_Chr09g0401561 [Helianthus annuus]|nr:hypothetical protein HanIR_Chr09g0401561 [Helianthus annuus]